MIFFLFHLNQIQYIASVARTIIFEGEMPLEHKYICFKMSIPMSPLGRISNKFRLTVWTISMESLWSLNIEINKGGVRKVSQITIRHISSSYPQHLKVMCWGGQSQNKQSRSNFPNNNNPFPPFLSLLWRITKKTWNEGINSGERVGGNQVKTHNKKLSEILTIFLINILGVQCAMRG